MAQIENPLSSAFKYTEGLRCLEARLLQFWALLSELEAQTQSATRRKKSVRQPSPSERKEILPPHHTVGRTALKQWHAPGPASWAAVLADGQLLRGQESTYMAQHKMFHKPSGGSCHIQHKTHRFGIRSGGRAGSSPTCTKKGHSFLTVSNRHNPSHK